MVKINFKSGEKEKISFCTTHGEEWRKRLHGKSMLGVCTFRSKERYRRGGDIYYIKASLELFAMM
jgi:hypothetical protein